MRLTSKFWVDAYLRKLAVEGNYACVVKSGAESAGAIFVVLNHMDGRFSLYGPAPQACFSGEETGERLFHNLVFGQPEELVLEKLDSEKKFDPDLWIVENEDRQGRSFLNIIKED